jgi:hypothetical protein
MAETVLFGRYRLLEPAGSGGSAEVWRALDTTTGDEVAVKRLHPIVFGDPAGLARLRREFAALRSLDEPHIVRVRDLEVTADEAAIILDFIPGRSLADRLASGPAFEPAEAVSIARDVAAALTAAHAAGLVHRDVTPGNILLDPDDGARLTDFGIALGGGAESVTATGQLMGTMRYLAPEQLRGAPATTASDLHALAAVTYEMLAGRPAYPASTPVALAEAQDLGAAPIETIAPALDTAVRLALAPDPAERPADVATFADMLSAGLVADAETQQFEVPAVGGAAAAGLVPKVVPAVAPEIAPAAGVERRPVMRRAAARLRPRSIAPPIAAAATLALAGLVFAAVSSQDRPTETAVASPAVVVPAATFGAIVASEPPTPEPTATPAKGKGKGKGNGKGHH